MATFDYTTAANQTAWNNEVKVRSWTIDFEDLINVNGMVTTGADQVRLLKIPAGATATLLAGTVRVDRIYAGTSATVDIGVTGDDTWTANVDTKVAAGTIVQLSTNAAPVLTAEGVSDVYLTAELTEGAADTTDGGKVTITLCYFMANN